MIAVAYARFPFRFLLLHRRNHRHVIKDIRCLIKRRQTALMGEHFREADRWQRKGRPHLADRSFRSESVLVEHMQEGRGGRTLGG